MQNKKTLFQLLSRLWLHISARRRWQISVILILMVCASFAEVISIGAIFPFLAVLTSPERVFSHPNAATFIQLFNVNEPSQLLFPLTLVFCIAAVSAGAARLLLLWASTRLSFAIGADLSISIYRRTLYQPYEVHISRNSSEIISGMIGKTNSVIFSVIFPSLMIVSSVMMLIAILIALIVINPLVAAAALGAFGLIYAVLIGITRKRKISNSHGIARESTQVIKSLQEGLGGIRDVLIDGTQEVYCKIYQVADRKLRQAQGDNQFVSQAPRYGMEAMGMVTIALLAYAMSNQAGGIASVIPVLGALALGAQRLLPIMQQAYASLSAIQGSQASLADTLSLLEQPLPDYLVESHQNHLTFESELAIKDISFRYGDDTPWVLTGLNLKIAKGAKIGFIGETGSGKSTFLDLLMGLLRPTKGEICVDGKIINQKNHRAWQANIAHVPQAIYLSDATIEENIAFGVPKENIDYERVREAAREAQIADIIESWPMQYKTFVGERGVKLSGGQRQRVGIARALYKRANVIVFDEATSALDNNTEDLVMSAIQCLGHHVTVLIIAHRLTTLKNCDLVVELADGKISRSGSYNDLILNTN